MLLLVECSMKFIPSFAPSKNGWNVKENGNQIHEPHGRKSTCGKVTENEKSGRLKEFTAKGPSGHAKVILSRYPCIRLALDINFLCTICHLTF